MKSVKRKQGGILKKEFAIYIKFKLDKRQKVHTVKSSCAKALG